MPTDLNTALTHAIEAAHDMKEAAVKDVTNRGTDDIAPVIFAWRNDLPVALIVPDQIDRDKGLHAVLLAAAGLSADVVTLTNDAHVTKNMINPRTGKEWGPGEMQRACDEDGACDVGLITDTLWTAAINREGVLVGHNAPYHVHKSKGSMTWVNDTTMPGWDERNNRNDKECLTGLVPDAMREAMTSPLLADTVHDHFDSEGTSVHDVFGLDVERERIHLDCVVAKTLMEQGFQCMLIAHSQEAADIITESMTHSGIATTTSKVKI